MNKQELIERIEDFPCEASLVTEMIRINKNTLLGWVKELDLPQPIKLKDVIARIKIFDVGTQKVWLNEILYKLGSDYGLHKYYAGYKQGKFDGTMEREKVTVPQYVADWIEYCKNTSVSLARALMIGEVDFYNYANQEDHSRLIDYLGSRINQERFARAWLDGYEVEKEKRYSVKIKGEIEENLLVYGLGIKRYFFARTYDSSKRNEHTRKELEEAGFGWVLDCEGIEIEEVTE